MGLLVNHRLSSLSIYSFFHHLFPTFFLLSLMTSFLSCTFSPPSPSVSPLSLSLFSLSPLSLLSLPLSISLSSPSLPLYLSISCLSLSLPLSLSLSLSLHLSLSQLAGTLSDLLLVLCPWVTPVALKPPSTPSSFNTTLSFQPLSSPSSPP